jgi:glycosyltransferase involved in cell wall biosynthesis
MAYVTVTPGFIQVSVVFVYLVFTAYFLVISSFALAFATRVKRNSPRTSGKHSFPVISVMVAARDEEEYLPMLVNDLRKQNYPKSLFEAILVDDHSEIPVHDIITKLQVADLKIRTFSLPEGIQGKKHALKRASEESDAELYVFTDADCRLPANWLSAIADEYSATHADLLLGTVDYLPLPGCMQSLFRLEFISLVTSGIGSAILGLPVYCNGANMAVRGVLYRECLEKIRPETPSGDDVFILHEIRRRKGTIREVMTPESVVLTCPPRGIREFMNQRFRWASKARFYRDFSIVFLGLLVFLTNLIFLGIGTALLFLPLDRRFIPMLLLKATADCILITTGLLFFKRHRQFWAMPLAQLLYPFYFFASFIGSFSASFTWKGRKY